MFRKISGTYIGFQSSQNVSDIKHIAIQKPALINAFSHAVILSIDSINDLSVGMPSIANILSRRKLPLHNFQEKLITDGETIIKLATEENLFNGFDEVWFYRKLPVAVPSQDAYVAAEVILSTPNFIDNEVASNFKNFLAYCSTSEPVLGLSDGLGLNYFTSDEAVAKSLEATYLQ